MEVRKNNRTEEKSADCVRAAGRDDDERWQETFNIFFPLLASSFFSLRRFFTFSLKLFSLSPSLCVLILIFMTSHRLSARASVAEAQWWVWCFTFFFIIYLFSLFPFSPCFSCLLVFLSVHPCVFRYVAGDATTSSNTYIGRAADDEVNNKKRNIKNKRHRVKWRRGEKNLHISLLLSFIKTHSACFPLYSIRLFFCFSLCRARAFIYFALYMILICRLSRSSARTVCRVWVRSVYIMVINGTFMSGDDYSLAIQPPTRRFRRDKQTRWWTAGRQRRLRAA